MTRFFRLSVLCAAFLLGGASSPTQAAIFTDVADFINVNESPICNIHVQGFDGLVIEEGKTVNTLSTVLSSTTTVGTQGPNLVSSEVSFTSAGFPSLINWNGANYASIVPQSITAFNGNTINVNFSEPTAAAGVSVTAFEGFDYMVTARAYDANNVLLTSGISPATYSGPVTNSAIQFIGFSGLSGAISRLELVRSGNSSVSWSPVITGVHYCSPSVVAIPEPSAAVALAMGAVLVIGYRRRRSGCVIASRH